MIKILAGAIPSGPQIFDESVMFQDQTEDGINLKEDFRNRFRNVSRIMDCVGCDKCRLWGKIQTVGFGTALKVLFEFGNGHAGEEKPLLRRTELVALINTLDKISSALKAIEDFRGMIADEIESKVATTPQQATGAAQIRQSPAESLEMRDGPDDFESPDSEAPEHQMTFSEEFWQEFDLVFRAWKLIMRSWIGLPQKLGSILTIELGRLWNFWLGKPVRPRSWAIEFPTRDDL
jgi:hypothetical protein